MRHRCKHLVLPVRTARPAVLDRPPVLALQRSAKGTQGPRRSAEGNGRRVAIMIREQSSGAVDGTGDPRGHRLVDGDGARAALVRCRRVTVAVSFSFALSLSFLVATSHLFVLLDGAMPFVHFALPIVRRATTVAVEILVVHADLPRRVSN